MTTKLSRMLSSSGSRKYSCLGEYGLGLGRRSFNFQSLEPLSLVSDALLFLLAEVLFCAGVDIQALEFRADGLEFRV